MEITDVGFQNTVYENKFIQALVKKPPISTGKEKRIQTSFFFRLT